MKKPTPAEMLQQVRKKQQEIQLDQIQIKPKKGEAEATKKLINKYKKSHRTIEPKRGEVIDEDRKKFDKFMKDARNKKGEEKLDILRKATKIHKELPPEDKG